MSEKSPAASRPPSRSDGRSLSPGGINHAAREFNRELTTSGASDADATSGNCPSCVERFRVTPAGDSPLGERKKMGKVSANAPCF